MVSLIMLHHQKHGIGRGDQFWWIELEACQDKKCPNTKGRLGWIDVLLAHALGDPSGPTHKTPSKQLNGDGPRCKVLENLEFIRSLRPWTNLYCICDNTREEYHWVWKFLPFVISLKITLWESTNLNSFSLANLESTSLQPCQSRELFWKNLRFKK